MRKILALTFAIMMTVSAGAPAVLATGSQAEAAVSTVFVSQDRYQAGEIVKITGSGWEPFETVSMNIEKRRDGEVIGSVPLIANADAEGKIANSEFLLSEEGVSVYYLLSAQGGTSNRSAATAFIN